MSAVRTLAIRPDPGGVVPETAMVMAAGLGKRMRPLTATRPKPLVEVAGKPLLDHALDRLRGAGIRRAVVNVHYLADSVEAHLGRRDQGLEIVFSDGDDARMDALLLMVPLARAHCHAGRGDFHLDANGRITGRRRPGRLAPFVWTGVQMLSPRLIADWPEGPFSTNIFWDRAIAAGRAHGITHQGLWFDVGTPGAIAKAEAILADG
ncbi:nucleotidyltransferase family protein [Sphingomonas sp. 32-62-10]|uniref:nucleotidyltransferase family protein n=1 Tax=Sphingomonas sp. 32-62-10 TaxID=1970436 RepID=UPI000BC3FE09|nr:MAG: mannose-1-phosphate guanylyltransferase [Sphingomonas sp. 32-62-10]